MTSKHEIRRMAAYVHVSTGNQNTAMQLADIRRLAELRGWEIVATVEEKASGAKHRPAPPQRLIDEAQAGAYDALVVWKLDRWGRSTLDVLGTVTELDAADVAFVSVQDNHRHDHGAGAPDGAAPGSLQRVRADTDSRARGCMPNATGHAQGSP